MPYQVQPFGEYPCHITVATVAAYTEYLSAVLLAGSKYSESEKNRASHQPAALCGAPKPSRKLRFPVIAFLTFTLERNHIITLKQ